MRPTHTISECHKIAEERGGKCLSSSYKNNKQKIKWQCKKWTFVYNETKYHTQYGVLVF